MNDLELLDEIEKELNEFRRETRYRKLTSAEWDELDRQMRFTNEVVDGRSEVYASGEHYNLNLILRKFGYYQETREGIMNTAWNLLLGGKE